MRKFKNNEIIQLVNILGSFEDKKLPFKIGYAVAKNLKIFSDEYNIYTKSLNKLFEEYKDHFIKDDKGNTTVDKHTGIPMVDDNVKEKYVKDINELLLFEVELEPYHISEEAFEYDDSDGRYDVLSPKDIYTLMDLLCDGDADRNKDEAK